MFEVTLAAAKELFEHYQRIAAAGANNTQAEFGGGYVILYRKFRDGTETKEIMRRELAELILYAIPFNEPNVERAKIKY